MRATIAAMILICASATSGAAQEYPDVPEPMVFDMVRPLGARRGELEVNTLAQQNLSGPHNRIEWAPEIEYAMADGFAVELELPLEGLSVASYKMGLQGTFGTFAGGRGVHGLQYLGVYDRAEGRWESTLVYLAGFRFDERWSTMSMIGAGDVVFTGRDRSNLVVNHSVFYDLSHTTLAGVEVNLRRGGATESLVMPQLHQRLPKGFSVQAGFGAARAEGDAWRPRAGLRVIKQF